MSEILATFRLLAGTSPWAALLVTAVWAWVGVWLAGHVVHHALLRISGPFPFLQRLLDYGFPSARTVVFFMLLQAILRNFPPERTPVELLRDINSLLLIIALTWLLVRIVAAARDTLLAAHPVESPDNLEARRIQTQTRVLSRSAMALIVLIGSGLGLMTFPALNRIGTSLLAAGGLAGVAVGFAAKPIFTNLLAGLQIALTQPIRLDDVVIVQNEWGRIGEITGTYVVVNLWDQRRLIVPLTWFIENPFQNWTRHNAELLAFVLLWLDYRAPVDILRNEAIRLCRAAPEWDGRLVEVQVVDANPQAMQLRVLVSAANADLAWHLRCRLREELIAFIQREYPECLPRLRAETEVTLTRMG
ncbi:MAG: mechanosensitive ion channel family protein [Burkholderiaceae bacterium]|nr:mechanosensitive ion channel family protein [Burkholderiaceae bacterium]